mmetsp:Transcript_7814/g.23093  ORF Transcript_7814/g.23093 Transcript_7814/m.23093 type:complete len:471 (-) Transcript_7814:400-1812(-)
MQSTMMNSNVLLAKPFTNAASTGSSRSVRRHVALRASKDAKPQQPSDMVMKTVGALAAAQMALFPIAGPAMADQPPIKAATDVGEAVQSAVPEGAANPKTREDRNDSRDQGIAEKLNIIKDRFDADKVVQGANQGDVFFGNAKNPGKGVSFDLPSAPSLQAGDAANKVKDKLQKATVFSPASLQVNVSEQLNKAAGNAAADAGQALKDGASGDVGADVAGAAKNAVSDVKDAAKSAASKLPGQGSKPVAFYGQGLQVNVGLPNPVEQTKEAARESAAVVKEQTGGNLNPLEALRNKIDEASITDNSPQKQLDQAGSKVKQLKNHTNVSFSPVGHSLFLADIGNASLAGPQSNEGGISQTGENKDQYSSGEGSALIGGDLKDSRNNDFAAQNKPSDVGLTALSKDAAPRPDTPNKDSLPAALGGRNLIRDDSESPEKTALGNIAKAKQARETGSGSALDSIKQGLGLQSSS